VSRRHVKEFRPDEALSLISADREGKVLRCPSCASNTVHRTPDRSEGGSHPIAEGRVTLACGACGRVVSYIDRAETFAGFH
jgi:hypothetical protein